MTTSYLYDLRAPALITAHEDDEDNSNNEKDDIGDGETTWDSTFQRERLRRAAVGSVTLCRHAAAVGCWVYGGLRVRSTAAETHSGIETAWWRWHQSLVTGGDISASRPSLVGLITSVASNSNGTVIVVATDLGVVALLRGSDGQILATRKVIGSSATRHTEDAAHIRLTWIPSAMKEGDDSDDQLLIETSEDDDRTNLILVTNVRGDQLNHTNATIVAEAAHNMQIQPFSLATAAPSYTGDCRDLRALTGCCDRTGTSTTVRLIACDKHGKLVMWDYDPLHRKTTFVRADIDLVDDATIEKSMHEYVIDFDVGFALQTSTNGSFALCTAVKPQAPPALFWFDPWEIQTSCRMVLPAIAVESSTSKVMGLEPISSFDNTDALAVAVAVKSSCESSISRGTIYVIQALIQDSSDAGTPALLFQPHVVYTVSIPDSIISITLSAVSMTSSHPYFFRCQMWKTDNVECTYKEFCPNNITSAAIGRIRSLLRRDLFDAADKIVAHLGADALVHELHTNFHPAEIAYYRLQHALRQENKAAAIDQTKLCLHSLASGATSQNETAMLLYLDAVDLVVQACANLPLEHFGTGLQILATSMQSVLRNVPADFSNKLALKNDAIRKQSSAVGFLTSARPSAPAPQLSTPFYAIRSPSHLYRVLIRDGQFELARALTKSNLRFQLCPEALVGPILEIDARAQPHNYVQLLADVVLPKLTINHELFYRIKSWCCKIADELDEVNDEHRNLNSALALLKTVDKAARALHANLFLSFGCSSPFADYVHIDESRSKTNQTLSGPSSRRATTSSNRKAFSSTGPIQYSKPPIPTILELGNALKLGATLPQAGSMNNEGELDVGGEDCVSDKLEHAQCLSTARNFGLGRHVALLRDFEQKGGRQFVGRELVRSLSSSLTNHEERVRVFIDTIDPFCKRFDIGKDQAMLDYATDLCRVKNVAVQTIDECASVARCCFTAVARCNIALEVLQAALLCNYTYNDLSELALDAIAWASCDSVLQSKLKEAFRLVQIDSIVLKYCGAGAKGQFRVDNPRHSIRLLDYVTKHVEEESCVNDVLSLCDGFHHLCRFNAASSLLCNALTHRDEKICVNLLQNLFQKDTALAERALIGAVLFSIEIVSECCNAIRSGCSFDQQERHRLRARTACARIGDLTQSAIDNNLVISTNFGSNIACFLKDTSLEVLRGVFRSIERLQLEHSIYVSLPELVNVGTIIDMVSQTIEDVALCLVTKNSILLTTKLTEARRVCSLLTVISKEVFYDVWIAASTRIAISLVWEHQDDHVDKFLDAVGLLAHTKGGLTARAQVATAIALCFEAAHEEASTSSGMDRAIKAASLLMDWTTLTSQGKMLSEVVSLMGYLDIACHTFTSADEGVGELMLANRRQMQSLAWPKGYLSYNTGIHGPNNDDKLPIRRPVLHSSWYIGDGILLPPDDAFLAGLRFCNGSIDTSTLLDEAKVRLFDLVNNRGAHALALRVICIAGTIQACSFSPCEVHQHLTAFGKTCRSLAERSLGGSGFGIMSSVIDSQLAVVFLLDLPMKEGFAAYGSCIPTAVKTNNFERLHTLSNVGMLAGSRESKLGSGPIFSIGWPRQPKFFEQCQYLSAKSKWWAVLREHGVDFDSQRFQDQRPIEKSKDMSHAQSKYAASLLPLMMAKMSLSMSCGEVIRISLLYGETFHLPSDLVICRYIEYLLSPASQSPEKHGTDCRFSTQQTEKTVLATLQLLHPASKRASVLRRCLIALDSSEASGQDYERYNMVLNLYHEALIFVAEHGTADQSDRLEAELDAVDRRRDVLAILSAYFQGDRLQMRPTFSEFFLPLQDRVDTVVVNRRKCGILGAGALHSKELEFDPLQPLETLFATSYDTVAVAALAPLCIPLNLPHGYIHARSLVARFQRSSREHIEYPSFENDVAPVLNRITVNSERATLAEWCSQQYKSDDKARLQCIDFVLQSTIQASTEIELRRYRFPNDRELEKQELAALDTLKQISARKDTLSGIIRVRSMLVTSLAKKNNAVKTVCIQLIDELDQYAQVNPTPESLIDFLLTTGSLLAAKSSLESNSNFSVTHFRQTCETVHFACQSVAEQHSHIDISHRARRFAHRWLFYGDEVVMAPNGIDRNTSPEPEPVAPSCPDNWLEENTMDFVMDLSVLQATDDDHGTGSGPKNSDSPIDRRITSTEETSALRCSSKREQSEEASHRAALRIAFVLAHTSSNSMSSNDSATKENSVVGSPNETKPKRGGLLTQHQAKRDIRQENKAFDLGLELLSIVFARSGGSAHLIRHLHFLDKESSFDGTTTRDIPKSITFAMRHRALRTASVLCPQDALEEVVRNEGYLPSQSNDCTLHRCAFGVFVAKEVEEMGLPLPHSDLLQLSSMHFLSYARTLWRSHRDDSSLHNAKGRLLLLLVELSLQDDETDTAFINALFDEMIRGKLPRTLLLSLERVAKYCQVATREVKWPTETIAAKAVAEIVHLAKTELRARLSDSSTDDQQLCMETASTVERLIKVCWSLQESDIARQHLSSITEIVPDSDDQQKYPLTVGHLRKLEKGTEPFGKIS